LRCIVVEDAERMMELNGEPSTRRWLPSHVYADRDEAMARMHELVDFYSKPGDPRLGPYVLAIEHRVTGDVLGHVGFSPFDDAVEVSYAIAEASRGHGYGAEALSSACRWAAAQWQLPSFLAITDAQNEPSRRTLEHAGFAYVEDKEMNFQGSQETVSCYKWQGGSTPEPSAGT
jgi:RimJ/RimL family protein N-acetyltransferase